MKKKKEIKELLMFAFVILQVTLIICRINEYIEISWWFVFSPILSIPSAIIMAWIFAFFFSLIMIYRGK